MVMLLLRRTFAVGSIVLVLVGVVCCIMPACNNPVPKLLFVNINNTHIPDFMIYSTLL